MLQVRMPRAYRIEYIEVPVHDIGTDEVLIEMKRIGICGSDIQVYHWKAQLHDLPDCSGT